MYGKKLYIHNAQSHSLVGSSNAFVASYLHVLIFGRPEIDQCAQEYFGPSSVTFYQKKFLELTQTLLQGREKLEEIEELGPETLKYDENHFYKGLA